MKTPMQMITFTYKTKDYAGFIISSIDQLPYLYWFYFNDKDLITQFGDDNIAFELDKDDFKPVYPYPRSLEELIIIIQSILRREILNIYEDN